METKLINNARLNRLIDAENLEEAHHVLGETDLGPDLRGSSSLEEIEVALEKKTAGLVKLLKESRVPTAMCRYFQSHFDIINLRILLKSGFGQELPVDLSTFGEVPVDRIRLLVKEGAYSGLPDYLEAAADETLVKYQVNSDFSVIDSTLDKHYFWNLVDLTEKLRSTWIEEYTRLIIDLANGRMSLRSRQKNISPGELEGALLKGGRVRNDVWLALFSESENMNEALKSIPSATLRDGLIEWLEKKRPVGEFDLFANKIVLDYLNTSRRFGVGPEVVFSYILAKGHEIKMVRLIMAGLIGELPPERIRERVSAVNE